MRVRFAAFAIVTSGWATIAGADDVADFNLYGNPGLIDMPTAQMQPDGQLTWFYGGFGDSERGGINFQILPRVSGTVRFSTINDFGTPGNEVNDRSFDLKFLLWEEKDWQPSIALGFRDFLGDSPYGAEYLVASKTFGDSLTGTVGVGWGRLGPNEIREVSVPSGQLQEDNYFSDDPGVFGGLAWKTPVEGLTLKAEYSPDEYRDETAGGAFERESDLNFGLSYRPNETVHLNLYYLYGSEAGFQLVLTGNPNKPISPQDLGAGPVPVNARPDDAPRSTNWANSTSNRDKLVSAMQEALGTDGIIIDQAQIEGREAHLYIRNTRIIREPKAIGRTARVLALAMPPSVETFHITLVDGGLPISTSTIQRSDLEAQVDRPGAGLASWQSTEISDAAPALTGGDAWVRPVGSRFSWSFNPTIPFSLFDPDEAIRADALLRLTANYRLTRNWTVSAGVSRWIIGEDQKTESTSTSTLPRVRSDSGLYFTGRDVELDRLTSDFVFKLTDTVYSRSSVGYFERVFGGFSQEVLWAPVNQSWALGAEVNYAMQREFDDTFAFTDYDIVTGHASLYWDTGYKNLEAQLDVGRYLAGDWGGTFSLSRRFSNGWNVKGYVTRTEVSPEEFGSGSYSKGVSITMPLRWGLPYESKSTAGIDLGSVSRDGGARLRVPGRLYERVRDEDSRSLERNWGSFWQ